MPYNSATAHKNRRRRRPRRRIPRLPTEICEEIISYVDNRETLWACSLVCRSWLPRSRLQLYRSARVGRERIHKFLDIIVMHPHLGVNVKQLDLGHYDDDADNVDDDSTDIYQFFSDIIPLLPKITSLRYNYVPIPYLHLPLFSSGLLSLTSLSLVGIKADSFGDFVRFVSFHKHLKELTMNGCSWERSSVHHYSFGVRWGRDLQKLSFYDCEYQRCLEIKKVEFSEEPVVPFNADHLAIQWATTMKAIQLDFDSAKADDATEVVVSSLTAYIRFCPNLHTVKLYISGDTLWVLRQLPAVLSGLVSLRCITFWFGFWKAEVILLGDNEKTWTTLDEDLGDSAKFRSLEYVEVLCGVSGGKELPPGWENDTGSIEDAESNSGREPDGEDAEVECREECSSSAIEKLSGEKGKQRQEIPWGAELTSNDLTSLHHAMDRVAYFHRRQKPLTDIFPRLSKRGVLWCAINRYYPIPPLLHITASNLVGVKSPNWRPRYRESMYLQDLDYS
ncbi:hypothetical protein NLI96_g11023 [Meripilus lineatus]|uniref:F-box domain-containing protein n=1 Tax=Meripilus lineatus TaxID=2056292 RepID=A0AAD5USV4_9APHY|nr:hypothetical protein NLI96_g11023 [Physisporinus lineatus]